MTPSTEWDLARLREETFVRQIDFHWEVDSTNTRAMQIADRSIDDLPLLVLAERQTQGRGRGANVWWSADGAVTFSLLIALPTMPIEQVTRLSLTVGLAVCQAIESLAPAADVALKWPNDVYLEGKKLAGILIEMPSSRPPRAIIGVGINVNNSADHAPPEIQAKCLALCDALETTLDRTEVLVRCLQHLERQWPRLAESPHRLVDQWRAYDLLHGRQVELDVYDQIQTGRAAGIDNEGALLLDTPSGRLRCVGGVVRSFV